MAFSLLFHEAGARDYLLNHPRLGREDKVRVFNLLNELRESGDTYRADPQRRLGPDSPYFRHDVFFRDSAGVMRGFWFVVSDASAVYGVLHVVYADEI